LRVNCQEIGPNPRPHYRHLGLELIEVSTKISKNSLCLMTNARTHLATRSTHLREGTFRRRLGRLFQLTSGTTTVSLPGQRTMSDV
jgi:hypothetical protein